MVPALLTAFVLAAPPAPPTLGEISAPLGHIGNVVEALPKKGADDNDRVLAPKWEGCEPQGIFLMRFLGGTSRALEQLQGSLDRGGKDAEKKLFGRKAVLSEVLKQLSTARFEARASCQPAPLGDGYRLELTAAPKKWCDTKPDATEGEFWFFAGTKPAAVISVQKGAPDTCKPRLSTILFDTKGAPRVQLHADWGGVMSTSLLGEKCQVVDFTLDAGKQVFVPAWKSCKR